MTLYRTTSQPEIAELAFDNTCLIVKCALEKWPNDFACLLKMPWSKPFCHNRLSLDDALVILTDRGSSLTTLTESPPRCLPAVHVLLAQGALHKGVSREDPS